jgi:hypothetical protein
MTLRNRPFDLTGHDFEKMWRFLQQEYAQKQTCYVWHSSRLGDWKDGLWHEKKLIPTFFREHAQLWVDAFDHLVGFVLSENGDNLFFILTAQGYENLYPEILNWTIQHWQPRYGTLKTEIHEYQTDALAALPGPVSVPWACRPPRVFTISGQRPTNPSPCPRGFGLSISAKGPITAAKVCCSKMALTMKTK